MKPLFVWFDDNRYTGEPSEFCPVCHNDGGKHADHCHERKKGER